MKTFISEYGRGVVIAVIIMGLLGTSLVFAGEGRNKIESIYSMIADSAPITPTLTLTDITENPDESGFENNVKIFKIETNSDGEISASVSGGNISITHINQDNKTIYVVNDGFNSGTATLKVSIGKTDKCSAISTTYDIAYTNPMITASIVSEEPNTAKYVVQWIVPSGASITSASIYRGYSTTNKYVSPETLINKGAEFIPACDFNYRNFTYTLNITNLTSGYWQHAVAVVEYTYNGENYRLVTASHKVQIQ